MRNLPDQGLNIVVKYVVRSVWSAACELAV
jgi:hypothetical protein